MLEAAVSGAFKRDMKACARRHWDMDELGEVMPGAGRCELSFRSRRATLLDGPPGP